uniref:Col_cuticle_N domain-containing protein n=1 Tax=Parastrongyloides trichosuri TaxID=131310 RepID=A0A0N4ZPB4_PARTI
MIVKFTKIFFFIIIFIFTTLIFLTYGDNNSENLTEQEIYPNDNNVQLSIRDIFGIFAGLIVAAPPIVVLFIILIFQRDTIKVGKENKYCRLSPEINDTNYIKDDDEHLSIFPDGTIAISMSRF